MVLDLTGKNAFVGGSSQGIGRAVARELALLGASVTVCARSAGRLREVVASLDTSKGQQHGLVAVDFSDEKAVEQAAALLASERTIHILVNNTGGPPGGPIAAAGPGDFLAAFHNHLIVNHLLVKNFLPGMKAAGWGRIVNIISTSVKEPLDGLGVSNTTRGAVASWAKTLAGEVGPAGITVNNVLPGYTRTGRLDEVVERRAAASKQTAEAVEAMFRSSVPLRRFAEPEEVAAVVAFLASPAAGYVSGINVPVDGGRTRSL